MCCANNDNSSSILYPRSDTNALAIGAALNYDNTNYAILKVRFSYFVHYDD